MFRPRLIPVLLLKGNGLVKTKRFRNPRYIGDPINAVRLFNDLRADELIFLDISAGREGRTISADLVRKLADETEMPLGIGGGFDSIRQIREAIGGGAEKVILGTAAVKTPALVREASDYFGASSVSVCIDVRKNFWGRECIWVRNGSKAIPVSPAAFAVSMQDQGAGEIIIQSISRDGMMKGYDLDLIGRVARAVTIPVVALGGAGRESHFSEACRIGMASAAAAGSRFVYQGARNGVLINYPKNKTVLFA